MILKYSKLSLNTLAGIMSSRQKLDLMSCTTSVRREGQKSLLKTLKDNRWLKSSAKDCMSGLQLIIIIILMLTYHFMSAGNSLINNGFFKLSVVSHHNTNSSLEYLVIPK